MITLKIDLRGLQNNRAWGYNDDRNASVDNRVLLSFDNMIVVLILVCGRVFWGRFCHVFCGMVIGM